MKGVIASAVIAVVIVAGSVAYTNHIDKVSRDLGEINDRVMAFLYDEDFDKIEMNISEVEGYINGGEQTDAVSHCRVLGFLFEHLPKNYKFKLENIL